jgi:sulfatase maturation enzyme AslB (radical SAM superfamily)
MKHVASYFTMSEKEFKKAAQYNSILKKSMLSFLEGIGRYGVCTPQPMGSPFFVIVSITQNCNLNCNFCYNTEYMKKYYPSEMSTNKVKKIIDQLAASGCLGIGFNGGEPTLREDIGSLISYAKAKDLIPLIETNAVLIDQSYANQVKQTGLCYAQVSLDGRLDRHDDLHGKKGGYGDMVQGIKNWLMQVFMFLLLCLPQKRIIGKLNMY